MGVSRYVYNQTIDYLRRPDTVANWQAIKTWMIPSLPDWAKEVPYQIKTFAVKDACEAVSRAKRKYKQTHQFQQVRFRVKRESRQSIGIPGSSISQHGIYYTMSGKGLVFCENLPQKRVGTKSLSGKETFSDGRLVFEHNRWWLCVPEQITTKIPENQGRIVAIDPGVRTFATYFSDTECGKIGKGDYSRLLRLGHHLDKLLSMIDSGISSKRRKRMEMVANNIRFRIRNLVDELHWKTIKFLTSNFDIILLPHYKVSEMTTKTHRTIHKKTVRSMLTFSFYRFSQRLLEKSRILGKTVIRVNEAYTSKTASWSGEVKNIGSSRTITSRGETMDRDINGARGIFLKALVGTPCLTEWWDCFVNVC